MPKKKYGMLKKRFEQNKTNKQTNSLKMVLKKIMQISIEHYYGIIQTIFFCNFQNWHMQSGICVN